MNYYTEAERKMLRLRITCGLSWEQIAEEMDVGRETVFYRLKRLRVRMGVPTNEDVVNAYGQTYYPKLMLKINKPPTA